MSGAISGHVYLVCFEKQIGTSNPKGSASHYLGWAEDVELRMAEHRAGRGARILAACVERGIGFAVVRTWAGVDRRLQRRLKRQHNAWHHCPRCGPRARRSRADPPPGAAVLASAGGGP
jgi:hypothetical protein